MLRAFFQALISAFFAAAIVLLVCAFMIMVLGGKPGEPPYCPPNPAECG